MEDLDEMAETTRQSREDDLRTKISRAQEDMARTTEESVKASLAANIELYKKELTGMGFID